MTARLNRVKRISGLLRYLLIIISAALVCAIVVTVLVPDQGWVTLGDGTLNKLYSSGAISFRLMIIIVTPIALIIALGVFWLQRLFGEYQQGHFFTDSSFKCYLWLVWLKAAAFAYGFLWPSLLNALSRNQEISQVDITVEAGTLGELIVLVLIVHLLKEAQQINDENKAFI